MAFLETPRFPEDISYGSSGGPRFNTNVVTVANGLEYRNRNWTYPRQQYDIGYGIRTYDQLNTVYEYFYVANGKANGFRFKDWLDYMSCALGSTPAFDDQSIGTGDGTTVAFQLKKTYTKGSSSLVRLIKRPVSGTVLIGIDGVVQAQQWTVNTATGIVTFDANQQSTINGATVAANCELTTSSAHGLSTGDTVHLSTFTGDWTALNGARYTITVTSSTKFTIGTSTLGFTAYSANGGQSNTIPRSGEDVTAGYEFDVPVRFDIDYLPMTHDFFEIVSMKITIIELFNE